MSWLKPILSILALVLSIWQNKQLRADGKREQVLEDLDNAIKALQHDKEIDAIKLSRADIYAKLREQSGSNKHVSTNGVAGNSSDNKDRDFK